MTTPPSRSPVAGGFLIAVGTVAGAVIGLTQGQISAGLVIGFAAGVVLALAVWLRDR